MLAAPLRAAWVMAALGVAAAGCEGGPAAPGGGSHLLWSLTSSSELTVPPGAAGTFTIRLDSKVNINSDVSFEVSGTLPPNSTATFTPQRLPSTARDAVLTIQTTPQTPLGAYPLTITVTEIGAGTSNKDIRLDVEDLTGVPDFLLDVDPTDITLTEVNNGRSVRFDIAPINGFAGTVTISVDGVEVPPAPVRVDPPRPNQFTFARGDARKQGGVFVVTLADRPFYPPRWTLTVRAVSGSIVRTRTLNFTISPG